MHLSRLGRMRAIRVIGLLSVFSLTLILMAALYNVLGVAAQTPPSPQKVTAIYAGTMSWTECAAIPLKFNHRGLECRLRRRGQLWRRNFTL